MKKIFIRSPYFIEVNEVGQTSAKIEVFLWNKGTPEPTIPNYTFTKNVPSLTQTKLSWNVSNLAKSFIKPIAPVSVSVPTEESTDTWCYMKVKRYKLVSGTYTLLDTEDFVCLNGFNLYQDGYNLKNETAVLGLRNEDIKMQIKDESSAYYNVFLEAGTYSNVFGELTITERSMYKIPLKQFPIQLNFEVVCEPKYTPITCTFINRYGGWQFLTFFKANTQAINVTSKDYNLLPSSIDYNPLQGQKKRFNFQGKQSVKCNTGWVDENYSELIQDLLLSEVVLLDNKPAIVKSQSFDIKTHLKDKNINYEIEFEFNYGLINDVI